MPGPYSEEIAAAAARMVVEDGMEYGPAKRRAAKQLGLHPRDTEMPDNDQLEDEVRAYLALFCAESQPRELAALRSGLDGTAGRLQAPLDRRGLARHRDTAQRRPPGAVLQ